MNYFAYTENNIPGDYGLRLRLIVLMQGPCCRLSLKQFLYQFLDIANVFLMPTLLLSSPTVSMSLSKCHPKSFAWGVWCVFRSGGAHGGQRLLIPGAEVTDICEPCVWVLGARLRACGRAANALSTEPSLQPRYFLL